MKEEVKDILVGFEHICPVPNPTAQLKKSVLPTRVGLCFALGTDLPDTLKCLVCHRTIKKGKVVIGKGQIQ